MKMYQYRIKDKSIREVLIPLSSEVNFVWNFCNDVARRRYKESRFFTNESDINAAINILRFGSEMLRIYLLRSPCL